MGSVAAEPIRQQINLYRPVAPDDSRSAGARLLLFTAVGAFAIVVALAIAGEVFLSSVRADRELVSQRLNQSQKRVEELQARMQAPEVDPFLRAELDRLSSAVAQSRATLGAFAEHRKQSSSGFSNVFSGLARNTVDGLWFNKVGLSGGGTFLLLRGQTREPALVPKLLQSLGAESAFAGRNFRQVSFEREPDETNSVVEFELRSAGEEGFGDAG